MRLEYKLFYDLSNPTRKKIRSLTFRKSSGFLDERPHVSNPFMILLWEGKQLNGWGALFYRELMIRELHFYIRCSERRKGLASLLMKAVVRQALVQKVRQLCVTPWDKTSLKFFENAANKYRGKIIFWSTAIAANL
jgi:hypothetical protein